VATVSCHLLGAQNFEKDFIFFFFWGGGNLCTLDPEAASQKPMGHQRTLRRTLGGPKIFKMLFAVSHSFADGHKALGDFRPRTDSLSRAEEIHRPVRSGVTLTFILLTWRIW